MNKRVYYYENDNLKDKVSTARYIFALKFLSNKIAQGSSTMLPGLLLLYISCPIFKLYQGKPLYQSLTSGMYLNPNIPYCIFQQAINSIMPIPYAGISQGHYLIFKSCHSQDRVISSFAPGILMPPRGITINHYIRLLLQPSSPFKLLAGLLGIAALNYNLIKYMQLWPGSTLGISAPYYLAEH